MKKKIILSLAVAAFAFSTVGCGGGSSPKKEDNKTKPGGGNKTSNLDIVKDGDLKIVRNTQSEDVEIFFKHTTDDKIIDYYIDIDNNKNTGFSENAAKGAEYRVVNHLVKRSEQKLYEVNATDATDWVASDKDSYVAYNSASIILTKDLIPTKYFSVLAVPNDINWTEDMNRSKELMFDLLLADSGNPTTITGDHGLSMKMDHNDTDISIQLIGTGYDSNSRLYLDIDDNTTGYTGVGLWKNLGVDYMIGNNKVSRYTAGAWSDNSTYKHVTRKDVIKFNIKRSDIGNPTGTIKVGVALHKDSSLDVNITGSIPVVKGTYNKAQTLGAEYTF